MRFILYCDYMHVTDMFTKIMIPIWRVHKLRTSKMEWIEKTHSHLVRNLCTINLSFGFNGWIVRTTRSLH